MPASPPAELPRTAVRVRATAEVLLIMGLIFLIIWVVKPLGRPDLDLSLRILVGVLLLVGDRPAIRASVGHPAPARRHGAWWAGAARRSHAILACARAQSRPADPDVPGRAPVVLHVPQAPESPRGGAEPRDSRCGGCREAASPGDRWLQNRPGVSVRLKPDPTYRNRTPRTEKCCSAGSASS